MKISFNKVTALPAQLEPNSFYFVVNDSFAESYLTDDAGNAKSMGNSAMINALVQEAITDWGADSNMIQIVQDITARDAMTATSARNLIILVIDATDDPTVDSGSALYAYDASGDETYKISEYESMDVTLSWGDIQGRPTSSVAAIDSAVANSHTHSNMATLNEIGENAQQKLTYRGTEVGVTEWDTQTW